MHVRPPWAGRVLAAEQYVSSCVVNHLHQFNVFLRSDSNTRWEVAVAAVSAVQTTLILIHTWTIAPWYNDDDDDYVCVDVFLF